MQIDVRPYAPEDAAALEAVTASAIASLRAIYRPTEQAIRRGAASAPSLARLVAVCDGMVVGTLCHVRDGDRLHVRDLGVRSDYRGRGVARRLVDEAARIGRAAGAGQLSLYTIRETGNVAVFERLGLVVVREEPATDLVSARYSSLTDVFMVRPLTR